MLGQGTMPNEEEVSLTSKKIYADIKKKMPGGPCFHHPQSPHVMYGAWRAWFVGAELLQGALQRRTLTFPNRPLSRRETSEEL